MLGRDDLSKIDRRTWNGHTHTEYCSHGSGEDSELFIEKAIAAGFKTYSFTEHFPMPPAFYKDAQGSRHAIYTAAMRSHELPAYLEKMRYLKTKYEEQIKILVGFEVDYFERYREWTASKLLEFGAEIDDAILSVHFLPTKTGLRAIDDSYTDFCAGVLAEYQTPVGVANAYLTTVLNAIRWETINKPVRYGHITLYRKWRNEFSPTVLWQDQTTANLQSKILEIIAQKGDLLDCNMSGLARQSQTEPSPSLELIKAAQKKHIPLVYGADAHAVAAVAQAFDYYIQKKMYL
ncbi:histidinol-phosphatase HisJ [Liquorilactobacillus satsumensis]|nr:histidinol-phosphatase HisJ [Liquorilactobacillus satsumensis]MCP9359765.1 histidinol-phosphatase HisJ [Liquorilactobacillus satsumensis]